ncbi:hypothetical protein HUU05_29520 [candidate division KSB1 bacterium]|nr:hypothetical protein [candidate division KSB1 bacterium]
MNTKRFLQVAIAVMAMAFANLNLAGELQNNSKAPNLEGTYKLITRQLPNGKMQTAPEVIGLITYTKTHKNFNVMWKGANGKLHSYSLVSTYKLTDTEYQETVLYSVVTDEAGGQKINYDLSGHSRSVPLSVNGSRLEFKMPFDASSVVFDQHWITTKTEGVYTDYWERVE